MTDTKAPIDALSQIESIRREGAYIAPKAPGPMPIVKIDEGEAYARSLMANAPRKCNGQKDGFECVHYWMTIVPLDVDNAEQLREGERNRFCMLGGEPGSLGEGGRMMPSYCTQYVPSSRPYSKEINEYKPLTPEEVAALAPPKEKAAAVPQKTIAELEAELEENKE